MAHNRVPDGLESLRDRVRGAIVVPGDDGWDLARQAWNLAVEQLPAMVALPETPDDVVAVVGFARDAGLRVAVQAAGHNASAFGMLDEETVLVKTVRMAGAEIDPDARRARVAAAAQWRHVTEPSSEHGLAALAGSSAVVGVVGYTLGGGVGWLSRRYGLAANSVVAVELVTSDGRKVRTDGDNEPELFWALRGGGGNFGVVTALELELFPVAEVYAGMLLWPWERAADILHRWREWVGELTDEVTSAARLIQVPPLPDVPEPLRGRSFVGVEAVYLGGEARGGELIDPLRALDPAMDTFATVPPAALGSLHMDPEDPVPSLSGHSLLAEPPPEAIDSLVAAAGPGSGSPLLSVELRHLGGALGEARSDAGALASVDGSFAMFAVGMPTDEASGRAIERQLATLDGALGAWDAGRRFLNFTERPIDTRTAFTDESYERLRSVKAQYDPEDVFRANHPIPPS